MGAMLAFVDPSVKACTPVAKQELSNSLNLTGPSLVAITHKSASGVLQALFSPRSPNLHNIALQGIINALPKIDWKGWKQLPEISRRWEA